MFPLFLSLSLSLSFSLGKVGKGALGLTAAVRFLVAGRPQRVRARVLKSRRETAVYVDEMRCWCVLVGLLALTVPLASDESATTTELADTSDVFFNATTWSDDDYYYVDDNEDEHQEFLPDPEALTADEEDEEEVVVLDAETRVVAEALIQELDDLSNKLNEDDKVEEEEDKPTASAQVSPADVLKLEKLLQSAGLTPNSPLMQSLMAQRRNAIPASAAEGAPALGSLLGKAPIRPGSTVAAAAVGNSFLTPGMTKKNVEEIKLELKHMLFGPDNRRTQVRNECNHCRGLHQVVCHMQIWANYFFFLMAALVSWVNEVFPGPS